MTKRKRKHICVGEFTSIVDNLNEQINNSLKLLDKANSVAREQRAIIEKQSEEIFRLKTEKSLLFKIKNWLGQKWKR